jgi:hypothetical protein
VGRHGNFPKVEAADGVEVVGMLWEICFTEPLMESELVSFHLNTKLLTMSSPGLEHLGGRRVFYHPVHWNISSSGPEYPGTQLKTSLLS